MSVMKRVMERRWWGDIPKGRPPPPRGPLMRLADRLTKGKYAIDRVIDVAINDPDWLYENVNIHDEVHQFIERWRETHGSEAKTAFT